MLNIQEDMVRTPYKKIIREVYKRKLLGRMGKRKINVENGQIENSKKREEGTTVIG